MRRFEYGQIQVVGYGYFESYWGDLSGKWQGGGFAFTESCHIRLACGVGKGTEYRGFKCD